MRIRLLCFCFLVLAFFHSFAQHDSTAFTADERMSDGIYLSYSDFRMNRPVTPAQINSPVSKEQQNFLEKALQQEKLSYQYGGVLHTTESKAVWGFFQNGVLYLNYKGEFYRVPVFGSISYFVATVIVNNPMASPMMYGGGFAMGASVGTTYREMREFTMDFYDGKLTELSMDKVEDLLSRDKPLYDEFMALSHRKRKDQLYRFIRRYNERHPIYFLKEN